jgi:hypothetical protein
MFRKKELQELKRLQRREARDQQLLNDRNEFERDTQERKFNEYRLVSHFIHHFLFNLCDFRVLSKTLKPNWSSCVKCKRRKWKS